MSDYYRLGRTLFPVFTKGLVHEAFKKAVLSMTPNEDGTCKNVGCSGLVKKRMVGVISGTPVYVDPRCDTCGKRYLSTELVDAV